MKVQDQFGNVLTVSDDSADRWVSRGYRVVEEKTATKAPAKKAASRKSSK